MKKISTILKNLKNLGVSSVKQSLEDEGASFDDIRIMRKITKKFKLKLNVKIGGCEAKNDIFFCRNIQTDSIVAPMIESEYAVKKFVQCAAQKKNNLLLINLETFQSIKNLKHIIKSKYFKSIDGVVIGRSDLAGSMGYSKSFVDSKRIYNITRKTFSYIKKLKKNKKVLKMGGSITQNSKEFIQSLFEKKILDYVETRNIEIKLSKKSINNFEKIIIGSFQFEIEWLKYRIKNNKNLPINLVIDYKKRINEIRHRLEKLN